MSKCIMLQMLRKREQYFDINNLSDNFNIGIGKRFVDSIGKSSVTTSGNYNLVITSTNILQHNSLVIQMILCLDWSHANIYIRIFG